MELLFFYLPGCPYCRRAEEILAGLIAEKPEYGAVKIRRVNESAEAKLAGQYDYWHVPSFFLDGKKLYEADPRESEQAVRSALQAVLDAALERS